MRCIILLIIILTACQPSTPEDFTSEGKEWMRSMIKELESIHNKEDLKKSIPSITKKYKQLALLIKRVEEKNTVDWTVDESQNEDSIALKKQLDRIFLLPKAKEIFETAQIDAFEILNTINSRQVNKK